MLEKKSNKVCVEIFGEEYNIKGDASPEHIGKVAQLVNEKMRQIAQSNPTLNKSKVAILVAINLADEVLKLQHEYQELLEMLNDR